MPSSTILQEDGTLYKPNEPSTNHVAKWQRVEAFLAMPPAMPHRAFVTSSEWGQIAKELETMDVEDPSKPGVKPTPQNFTRLKIGKCLTVINSRTEDQDVVNMMNRAELGADAERFEFRKNIARTG